MLLVYCHEKPKANITNSVCRGLYTVDPGNLSIQRTIACCRRSIDKRAGPYECPLATINEAPLPVAQIARNMGLTRQSVRRTANVLKDKGFVEFQENPNHQRAKLLVLSKKGRNVLDQVTKLQIDWANSVSKGLGDNKLKTVIQTMRTIGDRL